MTSDKPETVTCPFCKEVIEPFPFGFGFVWICPKCKMVVKSESNENR